MKKTNLVAVFTCENINKQLSLLKKYKNFIDSVEIRVDSFYKNNKIKEIPNIIKNIKDAIPKIKIIITFRRLEEGGCVKVSEKTRQFVITELLKSSHQYINFVDIEFFSKIKNKIINLAKKYKKIVILSFHKLNTNFMLNEITKIIQKMQKFVSNRKHYIIKIVVFCDSLDKYIEILKSAYAKTTTKTKVFKNISIFSVGKTSILSRLICLVLDMPIVYAALSKAVIKTQPTIKQLVKIKRLLTDN